MPNASSDGHSASRNLDQSLQSVVSDDSVTTTDLSGSFPPNGSSIHEDGTGEIYETDTAGNVFQLVVVP